jgi:hypothetical protein
MSCHAISFHFIYFMSKLPRLNILSYRIGDRVRAGTSPERQQGEGGEGKGREFRNGKTTLLQSHLMADLSFLSILSFNKL